jgi:galactose mutarotase-like enzyme
MLDFAPARAFAYNERLTDLARETAVPQVPAPIVHPTVNERIARVASNKEAHLILPDGLTVHLAAVGVEDDDLFPYVQLYTMPDKPFFCIEPWMAFPNALNTVAGARWLRPGQSEHGILRLWVTW